MTPEHRHPPTTGPVFLAPASPIRESGLATIVTTQILTPSPSHSSGSASPVSLEPVRDITACSAKKKKKKRAKKLSRPTDGVEKLNTKEDDAVKQDSRPSVLCISRNKHWKYISSYHGPWLQLPLELLESLLVINLDPATMSANETRLPPLPSPPPTMNRIRERNFSSRGDNYPLPESPSVLQASFAMPPPFPSPEPGKATPPPIDPGVFRSVTSIRRLIDEASELSVRATSGLSAAALGSLRSSGGSPMNNNPWATAQSFGINTLGDQGGGGRNVTMSATRVHRLRVLAVQKLASAYRADEIASSVMVMQGGSVFDDIAEKVLKNDPNNVDARYVHFFHEKIPSRQLAESTTTDILDELVATNPQRLEFFRTRGIVHCFRDEYALAVKDFTHALKETRALRRAKAAHNTFKSAGEARPKGKKKKAKSNGQAPPNGTAPAVEGPDGEHLLLHPSVLADAPDPIEPQLLFHRGAAYLAHALYAIEEAIFKLEDARKAPAADGAELRLCYLESGKYGGTEVGNPDGPLGRTDGAKLRAYRDVLARESFRDHIYSLLKKSIRDHEKFLSHFDTLESPDWELDNDLAERTQHAFLLAESHRPGTQSSLLSDGPVAFTTYHPLLVESHFSVLISQLLLGDFRALLTSFTRAASLVAGLEGYPVFLPPRSMAQAEFVESLERLAGGWKFGTKPNSLSAHTHVTDAPPSPSSSTPSLDDDLAASTSAGPSAVSSNLPSPSGRESPASKPGRVDLAEALDSLRILLAPVVARQKERADRAASEKLSGSDRKKPMSINIPLHGPRVEIVLAWLGAVHLPELEGVV